MRCDSTNVGTCCHFCYDPVCTDRLEKRMDSIFRNRMADMLERESTEAWEERKRKARVLGEAAATKLLVPMIMMLIVVMAIVMIPAFMSFYGET